MATDFLTRKLAITFNMYDADGSQFLEEKDFVEAVEGYASHLGIAIDGSEGKKMLELELKLWDTIKKFDTDGDEKVSLEEYVKGFQALASEGKLEGILSEYASTLVGKLDTDGDGKLSPEEFALVSNSPEGEEIFKKLDTDGSGYLTKDEVLSHMIVYFTSENPSDPGNSFFGIVK